MFVKWAKFGIVWWKWVSVQKINMILNRSQNTGKANPKPRGVLPWGPILSEKTSWSFVFFSLYCFHPNFSFGPQFHPNLGTTPMTSFFLTYFAYSSCHHFINFREHLQSEHSCRQNTSGYIANGGAQIQVTIHGCLNGCSGHGSCQTTNEASQLHFFR